MGLILRTKFSGFAWYRGSVIRRVAMVCCCGILLGAPTGCASVGGQARVDDDLVDEDPLEGLNRQIFAMNLAVDTFLLRPAAVAYRELMPQPGKYVIRNFVNNLTLPWTFVNDLAQGQGNRAGVALARFVINSTIGIGGLFDPATDLGLPHHREDFGQTLAVWGMESGPYLVLPLLGPSSFRDGIGSGVAYFADPVKIAARAADLEDEYLAAQVADAVDARYRNLGTIDSLRERSLDFYSTVRSLYTQRRASQIRNAAPDDLGTVISEEGLPAEPTGASPRLPPATADVPSTTRMEEASVPEVPKDRAALPSDVDTATNIAVLPPPRAGGSAASEPVSSAPVEPNPDVGGSSRAAAMQAFLEAQRAYDEARRSMSGAEATTR